MHSLQNNLIPAFLPASLGKTEDKTMPVRQACDHPLVGLGGVNYSRTYVFTGKVFISKTDEEGHGSCVRSRRGRGPAVR